MRVARSTTGSRFASVQLSVRFQAAPAATAIALVRSDRCRLARVATSAAATAASATPIKASASRRRIGSLREPACIASGPANGSAPGSAPAPGMAPDSVIGWGLAIAGQAQAVTATEDRLHDPRIARIGLDLAAQVLHVRVHGPLIPLELVPA